DTAWSFPDLSARGPTHRGRARCRRADRSGATAWRTTPIHRAGASHRRPPALPRSFVGRRTTPPTRRAAGPGARSGGRAPRRGAGAVAATLALSGGPGGRRSPAPGHSVRRLRRAARIGHRSRTVPPNHHGHGPLAGRVRKVASSPRATTHGALTPWVFSPQRQSTCKNVLAHTNPFADQLPSAAEG